jgi:hypothetical protein
VPDADGLEATLTRARRFDDFTRSTNVLSDTRRAGRFRFPLFEGTTIPSSYVLVNGALRSKGIAVSEKRGEPRNY